MAEYFYDTSAFAKSYHPEPGSAKVAALLMTPGARHTISRLGFVEFHSFSAKKCRIGLVTPAALTATIRFFWTDIHRGRFRVVRLSAAHHRAATRLIRRIGPTRNLRTLDALQLAVAMSLDDPADPITLVCADQALCSIAAAEGLAVVNPEVP